MASSEAAGEDRLSQLSDTVLGHNMSFLPAFDVAPAAVLWRRWCDTFVAVHTVSLHNRERQPVTADEDLLAAPPRYRRAPRTPPRWRSTPRAARRVPRTPWGEARRGRPMALLRRGAASAQR
jgi:hypothetical protein